MKAMMIIAGLAVGFIAGHKVGNSRYADRHIQYTPQYLYEED
jgi:hypothetical protein